MTLHVQQLSYFSNHHILDATPLHGGVSHQLIRVQSDYQSKHVDSVVRVLPSLMAATQEYEVMMHAHRLMLCPKPLACELLGANGVLVMPFVQGKLACDIALSKRQINQLAYGLIRLHESEFPTQIAQQSVNCHELIDEYYQRVSLSADNKKRYIQAKALVSTLDFENNCLIHGDLNLSNLIINELEIAWLDWEYASVGDKYFDYAALIIEANESIEIQFIDALSQLSHPIKKRKLLLFKLYYSLISWLWCHIKNTPQTAAQILRYQEHIDYLLAVANTCDDTLL